MIENRNTLDKGLESALKALEQAKQRVANEKKKQNEKKRKAENHHKYMMGGIVAKYFPKCYSFDEQELNRILSAALAARECRQMIESIEKESVRNAEASQRKDEETGAGENGQACTSHRERKIPCENPKQGQGAGH